MIIINKHKSLNLINNLLLVFSFSIPLIGFHIPKYILGVLLFFKIVIIGYSFEEYKSYFLKNRRIHFLLSIFFIGTLITILYSKNLNYGFGLLLNYSFFLIFQIVLMNIQFCKVKILKAFLLGVIFIELTTIILVFLQYGSFSNFNGIITYEELSEIVKLHPGYYSLMILIAIFINHFFVKKKIKYAVFILQSIFLFLLASRLIIILFLLISLFFCVNFILKLRKRYRYVSLAVLSLFLLSFFYFLDIDGKLYRLSNFDNAIGVFITELGCGLEICTKQITTDFIARIYQIKCSLQLVFQSFESFLFGYGAGDFKSELINRYKETGFEWGTIEKFNSHNQYLSTMLIGGIINLITLILYIFLPLKYVKEKAVRKFYLLILVLFLSYSFTESYLLRENGIIVVSFFISLILLKNDSKENKVLV